MTAMRAEAAGQISVSENCGLTSALHPIAAVRVVGFRPVEIATQSSRSKRNGFFQVFIPDSSTLNTTGIL